MRYLRYVPLAGRFFYALELASPSFELKLFWYKTKYFPIVATPISALLFTLQYTGYERFLTRRNVILLFMMPLCTILLIWTNEQHHLIAQSIEMVMDRPIPMLSINYGPAFWAHTIYSYLAFWITIFLLCHMFFFRARTHSRKQIAAVLVGGFTPWVGNVFTLLDMTPLPDLDLTPFTFTVTVVAYGWGLLRFQLLDIMPVAHTAIFHSMQDGVLVFDTQNRLVDSNPAVVRMLGRALAAIVGEPADKLLADYPELLRCLLNGKLEQQTTIYSEQNGLERYFDIHISPLYSRSSKLRGRLLILHETTAREQAARSLRGRTRQLRKMVHELQELDQLKSDFITNVSHELRTPLTNIKLYLALLARNDRSADRGIDRGIDHQRYLDVLHKETTTLQNLIETTLDLSRLDAIHKGNELNREPLSLHEIVERALEALRWRAEVSNVALHYKKSSEPLYVMGDRNLLIQVVSNLVVNAINYMAGAGDVTIVVTRQPKAEGQALSLQVADTGIGITPDERKRIFERFYRGNHTQGTNVPGFGLGLSIVKEIVQAHQGRISVESTPGVGSTFTVQLPEAKTVSLHSGEHVGTRPLSCERQTTNLFN